ncbi:hypothetical protein BXZ70DRAFT_1006072 [Cristinia sonorae]|uniref:Peptidase S9 prolyl oligopeptidase catalytic domain-containing protein n=1 Tax=Cristinia sonorae TaxID=1940300 RepID=A0A8K0UTK5_9AGAR|nr:hypothetical protein BXZ70DRAFT_1006072 [Cristinia sonorae]
MSVEPEADQAWRVVVSDDWDVLGPFPIHAREQHFISPSFPIDLAAAIDFDREWPSSYADNGTVGWTSARSTDGNLAVSFPDIRWSYLRASEGWAALQHHSLLRSTITVYPPSASTAVPPRLLVSLDQGSFFTVKPSISDSDTFTPRWYSGNIYLMGAAPPQSVDLPAPPSTSEPTTYELFISGDYEIRLFGDPVFKRNSEVPELQISLKVSIEEPTPQLVLQESHHVRPDFVDGWAFGDAVGVGLRSVDGWWTVTNATVVSESIHIELLRETRLAPTQTRVIPLRLSQTSASVDTELNIELTATFPSSNDAVQISVTLPVTHHAQWKAETFSVLRSTYFFASSMPTTFLAIPPIFQNKDPILPPVLALHGAGVDIINMPFWAEALPRQKHSWIVAPVGRTEWGLDWHGVSAQDALASIDALHIVLKARPSWNPWVTEKDTRVLIIGHSNGGQGAWHIASRFPDRVVGVMPAAAYIKSQAYISLVQSRSAHYIDPTLRAILETALTPDDNDLFLSNLVNTKVLAIHGGVDENVPVWHTRELVSVLKTWRPDANITLKEDKGQPHWYSSLFQNDVARDFLESTLAQSVDPPASMESGFGSFTLTVAIPCDSGPMRGFKIESLVIPGRRVIPYMLARLVVESNEDVISARSINVRSFSFSISDSPRSPSLKLGGRPFSIDGQLIPLGFLAQGSVIRLTKQSGQWKIDNPDSNIMPSGRLQNILSTSAPITIIIPDESSTSLSTLSAAQRLAHDLDLYHKLDTTILSSSSALALAQLHLSHHHQHETPNLGQGNLIILGGKSNTFGRTLLTQRKTEFSYNPDSHEQFQLHGRAIARNATTLFLHPHPDPENSSSLVLFMHAETDTALETALRLFPIRTGIAVPDWIVVVGEAADTLGAGGVQGAGVWGDGWIWNEALSSF